MPYGVLERNLPLLHRDSAVYRQGNTGDVSAAMSAQVDHRVADIVGFEERKGQ